MAELLAGRRTELEAQLRDVQGMLSRLDFILTESGENQLNNYQATIRRLPGCVVYSKRGRVESFAGVKDFILGSADDCLAANPGIRCVEPDYCFVTYPGGEFRDRDIELEYCQAVTAAGRETETIRFRTLEPVDAVCVMHKGPYEDIRAAYAFALDWAQKNGYTLAGDPRESYIDGIWNKEDPADWLTEIQLPVARA